MATRRPKVPRATLLDGGSSAPRKPAPRVEDSGADGARVRDGRVVGERTVADFSAKAREKTAASHDAGTQRAAKPASGGAAGGSGHSSRTPASTSSGQAKQPAGATAKTSASSKASASSRSQASGASSSGNKTGHKAGGKVTAEPAPVPARAFSGRLLALGLVMLAITVLLAPTVKNWWDQRQQIAQLQEDIRTKQAEQNGLKKDIARWHDPAYVQQQARDRINMVMPGEIGYWVFGKEGGTAGAGTPGGTTTPVQGDTPWTQKFLESVREASK